MGMTILEIAPWEYDTCLTQPLLKSALKICRSIAPPMRWRFGHPIREFFWMSLKLGKWRVPTAVRNTPLKRAKLPSTTDRHWRVLEPPR